MENEIAEVRDGTIIAAEINTIKNRTKREVLTASIEIGERLCEAKALVQPGEWGIWLHDKVDYSQSTAENLMRIYKEYGDEQVDLFGTSKSQTFGNLSYSQALALFALPADERENFVQENDVENMSVNQLQEAIEAKKQAEKEKADAIAETEKIKNQLDGTNQLLTQANNSKDMLEQALKKEQDLKAKSNDKIKKLKQELAEAVKPDAAPPSPEELEKLRAEVKAKVEAEFKDKEQQLTLEKKTAEDAKAEIEKTYQEKLRQQKLDNESILARQQAAEKQLALAAPEAQKFSVYIENFQFNFQSMEMSIKNLTESGNTVMAEKLRGALKKLLANLSEQLGD